MGLHNLQKVIEAKLWKHGTYLEEPKLYKDLQECLMFAASSLDRCFDWDHSDTDIQVTLEFTSESTIYRMYLYHPDLEESKLLLVFLPVGRDYPIAHSEGPINNREELEAYLLGCLTEDHLIEIFRRLSHPPR